MKHMNKSNHTFSVQSRSILGKKVKNLRLEGKVIGNISIPNQESLQIQGSYRELEILLENAAESSLFYVVVDDTKKPIPVMIDDIQRDPITQEMVHVTFRKVSLTEKVESEIDIEFIGEVEAKGGSLITVRDSVLVEALPTDLPESFTVDISVITEIGQSISLADLDIDKEKISLVLSEDQNPEDMPIVLYQAQEEEEEVADADELVEPEITGGSSDTDSEKTGDTDQGESESKE